MITKKQWDAYIWHLHQFKNAGIDLYIHEQKIVNVDLNEKTFATTNYVKKADGKLTRVKFSFEGSVDNYTRLRDLYNKVSFKITLAHLKYGDLNEQDWVDRVVGGGRLPQESIRFID